MRMVRYEVRENSRWNWNTRGLWIILDTFTGCVVYDGFMSKRDAEEVCGFLA
jgi:hypothetical protein